MNQKITTSAGENNGITAVAVPHPNLSRSINIETKEVWALYQDHLGRTFKPDADMPEIWHDQMFNTYFLPAFIAGGKLTLEKLGHTVAITEDKTT